MLQCLTDLFVEHGPPQHIRSDNGPEFAAKAVRRWLGRIGVKTLFIELLNGEIFTTLRENLITSSTLSHAW